MKARNVLLGLLLGAVVLLPACSSNSPTAPPPSPTPVAFSISLTSSPSEALVGSPILLSAHVTSGGKNVPDNTSVTFTISSCVPNQATTPWFGENMLTATCETTRTTSGGVATATINSSVDGVFEVVVHVPNASAKINLKWSQPINPGTLAIYSIMPNRGPSSGGQQVVIEGRGFAPPVTVDFIVSGTTLHAQLLTVNPAGTEITAVTPAVPGTVTAEVVADVKVTAAASTASPVNDTLAKSYTYERPFSEPKIYSVDPGRGSYAGGEQVTIYGANFFAPVRVKFGTEDAQVATISVDNARITVYSPRHPNAHLTQEQTVDVTVTTLAETTQEQSATLAAAYTYVPDTGVPLLYSVVPSRGSPRGGETVILSGRNFTQPVNVQFVIGAPVGATLPATIQSVSADGTQIILTTPQASPQALPNDTLADIKVTNLVGSATSQTATFIGVFTYVKEAKDIDVYAVVPNRGQSTGGERVVIAGQGFVSPVKVEFIVNGAARAAEVVSVNDTGTTIVATTPASPVDATTELVADLRVTAALGTPVEKQATLAAAFTYERQYAAPQIYAVNPNRGSYDGGEQITIYGSNFFTPLKVNFGAEAAQVLSSTESQIVVTSPRHPGSFITEEQTVGVTVVTRSETLLQQTVTNSGAFTWVPNTGVPLLYSVVPSRGSPRGGEPVTLTGKNFNQPLVVEFVIGAPINATLPATVVSVNADSTQATIITPQASPNPLVADTSANIRITNLVGAASSQSATFTGVFTYNREAKDIAIYSVNPNRGSAGGGQSVTIYGKGFVAPAQVDFIIGGVAHAAQVTSLAEDQIVCLTPAVPGQTNDEVTADVKVTAALGQPTQKDATLAGGFTFEKPIDAPRIYSVVPNKGSWAGGDTLTIIGTNFVAPLRVKLGGEDGEIVTGSTTPSVITVRTPLHPNTHLSQELPVDVTVYTSFETQQQQTAVLAGGFTWVPDTGVPLLYAVTPALGNPRGGESVILTGKNFTSPVTVEFILGAPLGTTLPATVTNVSADGTQITVKTPQASPTPVTQQVVCAIRITNLVGSAFSQTATFQGVFTYQSESDLAVYSVTPNRGKAEGGDTVQILGRGFISPVSVDFIIAGQIRHAQVDHLVGDTEAVVITPATGLDSTVEQVADIRVTAAAGTANARVDTLLAAFTYEKFFAAPSIYAVIPDIGSYAGNEVVTIVGANFFTPYHVYFGAEEASVDAGASTTTSLVVRTPQHLQGHLTQDLTVDVTVKTRFDTAQQQQAVMAGGFTWKPDTGVPLLYSVTPSKGDPRGNEEVTLVGKNFTAPVKVEFILGAPIGTTLPATITSIDSPGGVMKILTPQASPSPLTQEVQVDIRITNLVGSPSSLNATFQKVFTYNTESDLAIYSVSPNRGSPTGGQTVDILGRGFTAPVNVFFVVAGSDRQAQLLSIVDSGHLQISTPASNVDASVEQVANIRVEVAAGTANQKATTLLSAYTYEKQFSAPSIYAVVPNRGAYGGNETVTIYGANYFTPLRVSLGTEDATIVSNTDSQIVIKTPIHSPSHLAQDLTVDVTVKTKFETAQEQTATLAGGFTWVPDTGVPLLYSVVPAKGSPRGNETVILTGKNFTAPVTVEFILGAPLNTTLSATVTDVTGDGTQITVKTPEASPTPVTTDVVCDIRITNLVGSANSQKATFTGVFTYEGESRPPVVYFALPNQGSPRGGETITIFGRFFLPPARVQFSFTANGVSKQVDAEVVSVSDDGTQIVVVTPMASLDPLTADTPADIKVTSQYGTGRDQFATLNAGFLYVAEHPTPELYALTPNSGPIEGGTRITITGTGFQYPVQVFFTIPVYGAIQAQVVSVNFNQLVVISPSLTPMAPNTPTLAQVKAINIETGKTSNDLPFRYGNALFISAISPGEGPDLGGTEVTIFGQGFVAPVAVTLAGVPATILTVAGTEIVVKTNAPSQRTCAPISGPTVVTNIDSNLSATGPNFTYQPARPLITSVAVISPHTLPGSNIVQQFDPSRQPPCNTNDAYGTYTVTVRGVNFEKVPNSSASAMTVIFTNPAVEVLTTWVDSTTLTFTLPDLSSVVLDKAACTINGAPGTRDIPTGIPFTVKNKNNGCTDELNPAIVINPCDLGCKAGIIAVTLSPTSLSLGVGSTATMTACISAVQGADTNVKIERSGLANIVNFTYGVQVHQDPINLTIPAGQVCQSFTISALNGGAVGVVASLDVSLGGATATAQVTVGALGITLTPGSLNLPVGGSGNLNILLSAPAPVGGAPIHIAQSGAVGKITFGPLTGDCTNPPPFPATTPCSGLTPPITDFWVVIPAGSSNYTFPVNGINAGGPVNVTATVDPSLGGASASSTVVVGQFHITLSPITLTIPVGGNGTFTVSLDAPAYDFDPSPTIDGIPVTITQTGPGGIVTITSDPDGTGPLPIATGATGQVVIQTGSQVATFSVNGVSGGGPVTITVALPAGVGGATASSTVNVTTYIVTLVPNDILLPVGGVGNFTVNLNAPAAAGGVNIYINQTGQAGIISFAGLSGGVPPNEFITIPAGQITAGFTVTGLREGGPVTVTATLDPAKGSSSDTSTVTVGTLTLSAQPASLTVPEHGSNTFIVTLSKALTTPTQVDLTSSNLAVAFPWDGVTPALSNSLPNISIPAGSLNSDPIKVYGVNLGPATIYAKLGAALGGATAQVAINVTQAIQFIPSSLTVPTGSQGTFTLQVASAFSTPVPINLDYSGTSGAVAGPATVTIPANVNTVQFNVWGMKPTSGAVNIVATLPNTLPAGLAGATATGTVSVTGLPYALIFTPSIINEPVGASTNMAASFNYPLPPNGYGITFPVTVQLAMSAPGTSVIFIQGNSGTGNDIFTWTSPGQQVADTVRTIDAQANGGPVTITGVGPSQIGSPTGTAVATVGPASTTLTMSPSPFMWIFGQPAPSITVAISPVQGTATIIQLQSSDPTVVQVPSTVTIPAGNPSATFTPTIVGTGSATITATLPSSPAPAGLHIRAEAAAVATTDSVTVFNTTLAPATLALPAGTSGTLTLSTSIPIPAPITVTLSSNHPGKASVPASVTIPTTGSVTIPITAVSNGNAIISATFPAENGGLVLTSTINVSEMSLTLTPTPQNLYKGGQVSLTATMGVARVVPTIITLGDSGGGGSLALPATVTIPTGATSVSFTVTPGSATGTHTITANFADPDLAKAVPPTAQVVLSNVPLAFVPASLTVPPNNSSIVTASIAPAVVLSDVVVTLTNTAPALFTIPSSVTIPAGSSTATFTITTLAGTGGPNNIEGTIPATFTAAAAPQATMAVTVASLPIVLSPPEVTGLMAGGGQLYTVSIPTAQLNPTAITLSSDVPFLVSVPASVTIPAGQTSTTFTAIGESVGNNGGAGATITATLPAALGGASTTAKIDAVIPLTVSVTPTVIDLPSLTDRTITVTTGTVMAKDVSLDLSSLNPIMAGLFNLSNGATASVLIPTGGSTAQFKIRGLAQGFTGVDVNVPVIYGGSPVNYEAEVIVRVTPLQLLFAPSTLTINHGATGNRTVFLRDLSGNPVTVTVPATINVSSANPAVAFPTTTQVVIPVGGSSQAVTIFGNTPGGPVTITAAMDASVGGATATLEVGVSVVGAPTILNLSPNSGPDTGGTNVTINGTLFWSGATVTFGGLAATNVQQVSPSQITCTTPAHAAGAVDVKVTNPDASTVTLVSGYTYVTPGSATIVLSPNPLMWYSGAGAATMTIGISPVQGGPTVINLTSSNSIVANPPLTVTIPAATATATFNPGLASDGSATLTATLPAGLGGGTATALVTRFGLTFTPAVINVGIGATFNVAMTSTTSMPNPMNVALAAVAGTGSVSVPPSVTLPAGSTVNIPVTGLTAGNATVDVTLPVAAGGTTITTAISATVAGPSFSVTPSPVSALPIGGTQQMTITLGAPLVSDSTFTLAAAAPNFSVSVPSVTILAGQTTATFNITGVQVGGPNNLVVTPPAGFGPPVNVPVTVTPLTLTITPSTVGPLMAGGGQTFTLTINQAQTTALDVTLSSADPGLVSVPASVTIPANNTSVTFSAIAESVNDTGPAGAVITGTLPASVGGASNTATVSGVISLTLAAAPTNVNIPAATDELITVTTGTTLRKNVTVTIATGDPVRVGIFDNNGNATGSITILSGSNSGTFKVRGLGVGNGTNVRLDVPANMTTNALATAEANTTVNVLALQLRFSVAIFTIGFGSTSGPGALTVQLTDNGGTPVVPVVPVLVDITSTNPNAVLLQGVPPAPGVLASPIQVAITSPASSAAFDVFGRSPSGPVTVNGQLQPSVGNATATLQVGVSDDATALSVTPPLAPTFGLIGGGQTVVITGTSFWNNATVTVNFACNGSSATAIVTNQMPTALTVAMPAAPCAGLASITVTNPTSAETVTTGDLYAYYAPFTLTSVSPAFGGILGSTAVTITGTGFTPGGTYTVYFGSNPVAGTATSGTTITATSPVHAAGVVNITVTDGAAQTQTLSNAFSYYAPPSIASVAANVGPTAGGTAVTITGGGYLVGGTYTVNFGGVAATAVTATSGTTITCSTPAHVAGAVTVSVSDPVPTHVAANLVGGFTYYAAPTVTSVTPPTGTPAGSTAVTVNGTNFLTGGAYTVTFGGVAATAVVASGTTTITCNTPAHAAGAVNVVVTDAAGQVGTLVNGYTYQAGPVATSVVPPQGAAVGGTNVTINGTFVAAATYTVTLGGATCSGPVATASTITCTTGAHAAGLVNLVVTDTFAQNSTVPNAFTYYAAPTYTSVAPTAGVAGGGTSATITGTNFLVGGTYTVQFGGVAATGVTVTSGTTIDVVTPVHAAGGVTIVITDAAGQTVSSGANAFRFYTAPTLTNIAPTSDVIAGGAGFTLTGGNYLVGGTYTVLFGATSAGAVTVVNSTTITGTVPAHAAGQVNITLSDAAGQSAALPNGFTYYAAPTATAIAPGSGPAAGGTLVTVTGTNFQTVGTYLVTIDPLGAPAPCNAPTVLNSTTLQCTTGAHLSGGPYPVRVTDPLGQSGTSGNIYTYTP